MLRTYKKFIFLITILIVIVFIFTSSSNAFDGPKTHNDLARMSGWVYNNKHQDAKLTDQQLKWIQKGAIEEDSPAMRCVNHFYDPTTGKPIVIGADTSLEWAHNSVGQSVPAMGGDFTWEQAKYAYIDGDEQKAFESLGHVVHLVEDMAVPAHVRGDHHLLKDPFEEWVENNGKDILNNNIPNCTALDECMDDIASFTNKNFFSLESIDDNKLDLWNLSKVSRELKNKKYEYFIRDIDREEYLLIRVDDRFSKDIYYFDANVHADYWRMLSPKAVSYGARVIEIFFEEVEEARLAKKPKSVWTGITGFFRSAIGTVYKGKEMIENSVGAVIETTSNFVSNGLTSKFKDLLAHGEENEEILDELMPDTPMKEKEIQESGGFVFNGVILGKSADVSINSNSTTELWVKIKNTGISSWDKNQTSLNITTEKINGRRADSPFFHSSWVTRLRPIENNISVSNGDIVTLGFRVKAPANSGNYKLALRPVYQIANDFHWLGSDTASWSINVQKQDLAENKVSQPISSNSLASIVPHGTNPWTSALNVLDKLVLNAEQQTVNGEAIQNNTKSLPFSPTVNFSANNELNPKPESEPEIIPESEPDIEEEPEAEEETEVEIETETEVETEAEEESEEETESEETEAEEETEVEIETETEVETEAEEESEEETESEEVEEESETEIEEDDEGEEEVEIEEESEMETDPVEYEALDVVINEIAWMGTEASTADEWIELYNNTGEDIDLTGWILTTDGDNPEPEIELSGMINANSYFLLERSHDDNTVSDITADQTYTGALNNNPEGEKLLLIDPADPDGNVIDEVDCSDGWFAGINDTKRTMERIDSTVSGNDSDNWDSNDGIHKNGMDSGDPGNEILGTPRNANSTTYPDFGITYNQKVALDISNHPSESFRNYLKIEVYENKIYYAWVEGDGENLRKLAFGRSDIDGTGFSYKIIDEDTGKWQLDFLIYNGKAYFGWIEKSGYYNFYIAQADLSIIDDGLNENNYSEIQVTNDNIAYPSLVNLGLYDGIIRATWSSNGQSNYKKIYFVDFLPNEPFNQQVVEPVCAFENGGASVDTVISSDGKQYFTWSYINVRWGSMSFEDDPPVLQDFSGGDSYRTENSKIAITDSGAELFWKDKYSTNKIYYSKIDTFAPQILIEDAPTKDLYGLKTLNNKSYLLYNQNIPDAGNDRRTVVLKEISGGIIENTYSYIVDPYTGDDPSKRDFILTSDIDFDSDDNPIISWIEQDKQDKHYDILMMNVSFE